MSDQVYGLHAVQSLLERRAADIELLLVQQGRQDKRLQQLIAQIENAGLSLQIVPREKLDALAAGGRHQGVVAQVSERESSYSEKQLPELLAQLAPPALILVLDGVTDPHNLGACLRSADASGVGLVIAPKDKSASLNATVRKVACGAAETVPFVAVTNLARTLKQLQEAGVWLVGLAGEAEQSLYDVDLRGPIAIVMGAEGAGLRRLTRENCDYLAKLPMAGAVSSLNVSVATGVVLFEVVRQRR
ncbi:MAG TPA: 23S rRNA (guanosine(2251)-2'-O)-methyltransferase RlmB [Spongiibacteraceae bacterium]|nr:23S rRNA (guanosine(2251)-2'-O)-methyltransferase RlmB [Spongiibacteraceae bacterium]HCS26654.1 23S rRNA (guanosine(2251)-2'-O)-methyltransferase RlmB [Spongiibacteraceae bacterium]